MLVPLSSIPTPAKVKPPKRAKPRRPRKQCNAQREPPRPKNSAPDFFATLTVTSVKPSSIPSSRFDYPEFNQVAPSHFMPSPHSAKVVIPKRSEGSASYDPALPSLLTSSQLRPWPSSLRGAATKDLSSIPPCPQSQSPFSNSPHLFAIFFSVPPSLSSARTGA
jgi:hypothetical protein